MLKNLLLLTGFSTFAVVVIVGLNIYHTRVTSTTPPATRAKIISIDPSFDSKTINELKKRSTISENLTDKPTILLSDSLDTASSSPTIAPTPTAVQPTTAQIEPPITP